MSETRYDRRAFMAYFSSVGLGSTLLPGVLWAQAAQGVELTKDVIAAAEKTAGLEFTDAERTSIAQAVNNNLSALRSLRAMRLDYTVPPALVFDPLPPGAILPAKRKVPMIRERVPLMARPGSVEELAYATVAELAPMVRARRVRSAELTDMYLSRLKRFDPQLHFVVTLTEERARAQAREADRDIAAGRYRGPLHGIPWGAKDLLAVKGYPTTWGASPYKDRTYDYDAEVVKRLDRAGAVLVAKLTLGALAQGDRWYGEMTRTPWDTTVGASGSSAGPGSATAAGCVGFSIGTETQGSISSPSTRNGVTGHRPTFGWVPRTGAMPLSWTMDKIGPMCRSAEDCALVFDAIYGPDHHDRAVKDYAFNWNASLRPAALRVGWFDRRDNSGTSVAQERTMDAVKILERLGARVTKLEQPAGYNVSSGITLNAESGAAFQEDLLAGRLASMTQEPERSTWPGSFRSAQFVPAVAYVNAQRARTVLCQQWWDLFKDVDVIVTQQEPLSVTNLTGTPSVIVPAGFAVPTPQGGGRGRGGGAGGEAPPAAPAAPRPEMPVSIAFLGALYQDERILAAAHAYQKETDFHRRRPAGFR